MANFVLQNSSSGGIINQLNFLDLHGIGWRLPDRPREKHLRGNAWEDVANGQRLPEVWRHDTGSGGRQERNWKAEESTGRRQKTAIATKFQNDFKKPLTGELVAFCLILPPRHKGTKLYKILCLHVLVVTYRIRLALPSAFPLDKPLALYLCLHVFMCPCGVKGNMNANAA